MLGVAVIVAEERICGMVLMRTSDLIEIKVHEARPVL